MALILVTAKKQTQAFIFLNLDRNDEDFPKVKRIKFLNSFLKSAEKVALKNATKQKKTEKENLGALMWIGPQRPGSSALVTKKIYSNKSSGRSVKIFRLEPVRHAKKFADPLRLKVSLSFKCKSFAAMLTVYRLKGIVVEYRLLQ